MHRQLTHAITSGGVSGGIASLEIQRHNNHVDFNNRPVGDSTYRNNHIRFKPAIFTLMHTTQAVLAMRKMSVRPSVKRVNCHKRTETSAHILHHMKERSS